MTKLLTSLGMALSMFCMASANAAIISVSPLTQDVGPFGPDFTVGIVGNGFPQYAPGDLGYGGQIDISWDSSVITLGDPTDISLAGWPWSIPDTFIVSLNLPAGTLRVQVGAPGGMPVRNPSIATLNFTPVSVGTSDISLSSVVWVDALGTPLVGFVTDQSGQVNVIPVPTAVWLFVSGLLGIVGIARKRDPKRAIKYRNPGREKPHSGLNTRGSDRFVIPRASITIVLCTAIAGYLVPGTACASYWDVTFTARQVWSVGLVDDGETIFQGDPDLFFAMQIEDANSGVRSEQVFFEGSYVSTTKRFYHGKVVTDN